MMNLVQTLGIGGRVKHVLAVFFAFFSHEKKWSSSAGQVNHKPKKQLSSLGRIDRPTDTLTAEQHTTRDDRKSRTSSITTTTISTFLVPFAVALDLCLFACRWLRTSIKFPKTQWSPGLY